MTTRPNTTTDPLNWADNGTTADVIDPGVAKQAVGWVDFEPINNGHVNEMLRRFGEFLIYLDSVRTNHRPFIVGKDDEAVPIYSATTMVISFAAGFTANINGQRFEIDASETITVVSGANPTIQILYVDTNGVLSLDVGVTIGGVQYEPSPMPAGAIIERFLVPALAVNLAGVSVTFDYRIRNPHAPFRLLHEAYDAVSPREAHACWLQDEHLGAQHDQLDAMNSVTTIVGGAMENATQKNTLACTGTDIICAGYGAVDPKRFHPDFRTLRTTYALVGAKLNGTRKIVTDGIQVCVIQDKFCELFDLDGTHKWSHDHTVQIYDVIMRDDAVYICGVTNATPHSVKRLNRVNGTVVWGYNHNADVAAIWADDKVVHFDGSASGHASTATFRIIDSADGYDLANEGGTGLSTTGQAVDAIQANTFQRYKYCEAPDGQLYRVRGAAAPIVEEHGRRHVAGVIPTGRSLTLLNTSLFNAISVDQDYVMMADGNRIVAIDRASMTPAHTSVGAAAATVYGIATDGQRVYVDSGLTTASVINSIIRGNRAPTDFMKFDEVNATTSENFARNSMIPVKR